MWQGNEGAKVRFFLFVDLETLLLQFCGKQKEKNLNNFLFYRPTLNIICFVEKNHIFLSFCLCIFESDTVKSDCPFFRKIMKDLKI